MSHKILVVDDEEDIVMIVQARMETSGFNVITAQDGQEALQKAKEEGPDLIILDVMMPKMDGFKVCGLLKADQRYNNIPIIMLTARAQSENENILAEVGAEAYLTKPFDAEELLGKVNELLKISA